MKEGIWVSTTRGEPITHLADASRGLMHGSVEASNIGRVPLWSVVLVAIFAPLTIRLHHAER